MNIIQIFFLFIFVIICVLIQQCSGDRTKRFLTFPRTSPTRMQIISGIGIPVDLDLESVTIGYVFKAEYFLPENASNYLNILADPFDITPRPLSGGRSNRQRRSAIDDNTIGFDSQTNQKYEKYEVQPEVIESKTDFPEEVDEENDNLSDYEEEEENNWRNSMGPKQPQDFGTSRWTLYKGLEMLAESKGLEGRACVLRSICEASHASFDYSNGILGELFHIIMTPSSSKDDISEHSHLEYFKAEEMGRKNEPCDKAFRECHKSILDQFTGIYTPVMNLIDRIIS